MKSLSRKYLMRKNDITMKKSMFCSHIIEIYNRIVSAVPITC